ncbi:MAG: hypothetical protein GY752_04215 [bacterium]|nr:hypothetical protein [bacterium]MCP4799117.1 hypothetical protein [bacterium]
MYKCYRFISLATLLTVLLVAASVSAYEILLDIDTDSDPTTINDLTQETSAMVKLILAPSFPGEVIGRIEFGLGGSCLECEMVHNYGTNHDLIQGEIQQWVQASAFDSGWDAITLLGCPGNPGAHLYLWLEPVGGGTVVLNDAFFLAEFNAWVADDVPAGCQQPPSNLAALEGSVYWNYIQLGGPAVSNQNSDWGGVKALFR